MLGTGMVFNCAVGPWLDETLGLSAAVRQKHFCPVLGEMKYFPSNGCSMLNSRYQNEVLQDRQLWAACTREPWGSWLPSSAVTGPWWLPSPRMAETGAG